MRTEGEAVSCSSSSMSVVSVLAVLVDSIGEGSIF